VRVVKISKFERMIENIRSKREWLALFAIVAFLAVLMYIFINVTWLFRSNPIEHRRVICAFKNEDSIDVVLYGGSNTLKYYEPLEAWNQRGFTSYNYATSSAKVDMLKYFCEESRKTNQAQLYVFDVRAITMDYVINEGELRNWSDSVEPLSINRIKEITNYLRLRNWTSKDVASYYLDILKYHSEYERMGEPEQWEFLNRENLVSLDKGFEVHTTHNVYDIPIPSSARIALSQKQKETLSKLLDYCDKNKLNALFIVNPYIVQNDDWGILNAAGDLILERGYPFVNFNFYYSDIGLDFNTDFADCNHVNFLGVEKYTSYLANYFADNYSLVDHRMDSDYREWNELYVRFKNVQSEYKTYISEVVESHMKSIEDSKMLCEENDFSEWYNRVASNGDNITLLVEKSGITDWKYVDSTFARFLNDVGLILEEPNFVAVKSGDNFLVEPEFSDNLVSGEVGKRDGTEKQPQKYEMCAGLGPSIVVAGKEYVKNGNGIHIVAYNNVTFDVVDSIYLDCCDNRITINR